MNLDYLFGNFSQAAFTKILTFVISNIFGITAEDASRFVFFENYFFTINVNFQCILLFNSHSTS